MGWRSGRCRRPGTPRSRSGIELRTWRCRGRRDTRSCPRPLVADGCRPPPPRRGCQVAHRMYTIGHWKHLGNQPVWRPAANGFGDQRAPPTTGTGIQHRRMELDEPMSLTGQAGPQRQGDAVTGRASGWWSRGTGGPVRQWPGSPMGREDTRPLGLRTNTPVTRPSSWSTCVATCPPDVQQRRRPVQRPLHLGARGAAAGVDDPAPGVAARGSTPSGPGGPSVESARRKPGRPPRA